MKHALRIIFKLIDGRQFVFFFFFVFLVSHQIRATCFLCFFWPTIDEQRNVFKPKVKTINDVQFTRTYIQLLTVIRRSRRVFFYAVCNDTFSSGKVVVQLKLNRNWYIICTTHENYVLFIIYSYCTYWLRLIYKYNFLQSSSKKSYNLRYDYCYDYSSKKILSRG